MKKIKPVHDRKTMTAFIDFPHELYKNDPMYVPELFTSQHKLLTSHPFHEHSTIQCFLLYDQDQIVGRIAAIVNNSYNAFSGEKAGFFGFFDVADDVQNATLLFLAAQDWLRHWNLRSVTGPVNFSTNESCGVLIEGFDHPPVVMMPYNAPYYARLLELGGFTKKVDLLAWRWEGNQYNDRVSGLMDVLLMRLGNKGVTIRKVDMKNFSREAALLREVYNNSWDNNSGFVPMNASEFNYQANDLKLILDPDFCQVAEKDGKIIGLGIAIPDLNQIQKKLPKGRLFPLGWIRLMLGIRKVDGIRILLLGVLPEHRKLGIEACLYGKIIEHYRKKGYRYAEASWTLEQNHMVNNAIIAIGGKAYKRYRLFQKQL